MGIAFVEKTPFRTLAGSIIYGKGESVTGIGLVLQGVVEAVSEYGKIAIGVGSVIGLMDVDNDTYYYDYIVKEDATIYPFEYQNESDIQKILQMGNDYPGAMITSLTMQVLQVMKKYEALVDGSTEVYEFLKEYSQLYENSAKEYYKEPHKNKKIEELESLMGEYFVPMEEGDYFQSLSSIPVDIQKNFFGASASVTTDHVLRASRLVGSFDRACKDIIVYFSKEIPLLINKGLDNLFSSFSKLAIEVGQSKGDNRAIIGKIDRVIEEINKVDEIYTDILGLPLDIDREWMQELYFKLLSSQTLTEEISKTELNYSETDISRVLDETRNAAEKIFTYSQISEEEKEEFLKLLIVFKDLKNKTTYDDVNQKVRARISQLFYQVYESVFFRAEDEKNTDRLIDMFLNFGFLDETLFDKEYLLELYYLEVPPVTDQIYTIRQWLHAIYTGEKEPSVNDFGLDYQEKFRELKRTKSFTPQEEREYLEDKRKKIHFEIVNLFRQVNRMTSGHITTFYPILYQDSFIKDIKRSFIEKKALYEELQKLMNIDFSVFHREHLYQDESGKIDHEYIVKKVLPDMILMPNVGSRGVMWQEITGKRRDTPARFLFSIFTSENISDMLINVLGTYRWEICKTIQGVRWNDIREKSLTAEYNYYLQFYKKNRELTDTAKERVKSQIQKNRSSYREVFVRDYENWIKYESAGALRLNKISRAILCAYCPFSSEYRKKLFVIPAFLEGLERYEREKSKKLRELNNRYTAIQRKGLKLPELLSSNLEFYKDM